MQIPILSGVYTDKYADFRIAYPVNLVPVPMDSGISKGYLRPAEGAVLDGTGPTGARGGINWNGSLYRVMGTKLIKIDSNGAMSTIGDVGIGGQCSMDYSFDRLAIVSDGRLYYWDGINFLQVTDPDLGSIVDVCFVDGYFMLTDSKFLIVTELTDPTSINPLKYGSSELDPDPINSVIRLRSEVYAVNRYTIEIFSNVGGDYFPFSRVTGAQIQKGSVGTFASCIFIETIAFVGSGRNESPGIYLGFGGSANKISTRDIDLVLSKYSESELSQIIAETRNVGGRNQLLIHLLDKTLVYDADSSKITGESVWFILSSSSTSIGQYRIRDHVWCYDRWNVADPSTNKFGHLTELISSHWGEMTYWEFSTQIVYNEGKGAIIHEIELVALVGRVEQGKSPEISTCYSVDGMSWSQERFLSVGKIGDRLKRIVWLRNGKFNNFRIQKFKGNSDSYLSIARLEARMERLQT